MADNFTFDVKLTNNKTDIMAALGDNVQKALEECGLFARSKAKELLLKELNASPPSWYHRTGALRNNINYEIDVKEGTMTVGSPQEYAIYVEMGTGIYAEKGDGRRTPWGYVGSDGEMHFTWGMKPRPFIKPSVANYMNKYKQIIVANLKS